jgi:hypothetical protein
MLLTVLNCLSNSSSTKLFHSHSMWMCPLNVPCRGKVVTKAFQFLIYKVKLSIRVLTLPDVGSSNSNSLTLHYLMFVRNHVICI